MKKRMIAAMLTAMTALSVFGVTAMADDDELVLFTWENMFPQEYLEYIQKEDQTWKPETLVNALGQEYQRSYKNFDLEHINYGLTWDVRWVKAAYEHTKDSRW